MKSRWFVILAVLLTLGLVACGGEVQEAVQEVAPTVAAAVEEAAPTIEAAVEEAVEEAAEEPAEEEMMEEGSIWVLLPDSASSARWETDDRRYFEEAFEAAGVEYNIVNAEGDARTQQTQFEQAITAGAKVILLVNLDSGSAAAMIASARDAGVKVVDYDRLTIEGPGADVYVSFDNVAVGATMGEVLEPLINAQEGTPEVVLLNGAPTDNNATLFREGYVSYAQPHFDDGSWNLVDDQAVPNWDNQEALVIFEQIYTAAEGNISAVFAANDGLAGSVISALQSAGVDPGEAGIPISGQDATVGGIQHVLAGDQAMSVYKPIKAEAEAAAAAGIALLKGEDLAELTGGATLNNGTNDIPFVALTPVGVTKDNVADTVIADGFRTWEELCVGDFQQYCPEDQGGMAMAEGEAEEEMMHDGPAVVSENGCEYGGKIESIVANGDYEVVFNLCKSDPAFVAKAAFTPFGIQPSEHIEATGGGGELLENPIGTGAYKLDSWNRGDSIIMSKFEDYWGEPAIADTLVFRWATESASRLLELQSGAADYITNLAADDFATVDADPSLDLVPLPAPNILYIAMTNTFEPFDNVDVRKAVAMGIDRGRIVENFYPEGSEVASHFTPCAIPGGCEGEEWYEFDAAAAKQMLADAGFPDGFETTIYYRDVFRDYLPEPGTVAVELQTQLQDNLGITAEVVVMESGEFIDESTNGRLDGIYLLGWTGDYPHPTNFLDFHFSEQNPQFGDPHPEIYEPLVAASQIAVPEDTLELYGEANNAIKELVPMVPVVHSVAAYAARTGMSGINNPPFGSPIMRLIDPGKDTLVFMKNAEPISLYCGDETDGESLDTCQQIVEALYAYDVNGVAQPSLAEECTANEDLTVYTCTLREGVKFHDGSDFDSADVIASWGAGIDASNPNHVGNTGSWEYYSYLWDGLMNQSE